MITSLGYPCFIPGDDYGYYHPPREGQFFGVDSDFSLKSTHGILKNSTDKMP